MARRTDDAYVHRVTPISSQNLESVRIIWAKRFLAARVDATITWSANYVCAASRIRCRETLGRVAQV